MKKLLATKLCSRNLFKGINIYAVSPVKYSGLFLKLTREEIREKDPRIRKLMTINKALHHIVVIFIVILTTFRPILSSAFFRCFMSNSEAQTELRIEPFIFPQILLTIIRYKCWAIIIIICYLPVVGIELATSKWFHLEALFNHTPTSVAPDKRINYVVRRLPLKEYKTKYDWAGAVIHWELCKRVNFDHTIKWYICKPESIQEIRTKFWEIMRYKGTT